MLRSNPKFAAKTFLILALALLLPLLELALPINQFSFRIWESLLIRRKEALLPGLFYPNREITMVEVGDLAPYKKGQIARSSTWRIDRAGYRNSTFCDHPRIIVLGDSMATGTGLSQPETVNDRLSQALGECVYSFNHDSLENALKTSLRWHWQPKLTLFVIVERTLADLAPFPTIENPPKIRRGKFFFQEAGLAEAVVVAERLRHSNFAQYRNAHGFLLAVSRAIFGHEFISDTPENQKMLFFRGEPALDPVATSYLLDRADLLASYREKLRQMGSELLVVIVPNKESIYPELIPSERRSSVLPAFYNELAAQGVPFVDLYQPYREGFLKKKAIYYHLDDTHWNSAGAALAVELIRKKIPELLP